MQSYTEKQKIPTLQYLADMLCEDKDMDYVLKESQKQAKLNDKIDVSNLEFVYTKLEEYPYEFKIDGSLRLAAVNGIEIADNNINKDDFVSKEEYNTFLTEYQNLKSEQEKLKQEMGDLTKEVQALKNRSATYMIDTSRLLKTLEIGELYTATEDCIFVGFNNAKPGGWWNLYVDGKEVGAMGENGAGNICLNFPSIFLKKGSTIHVTGSLASEYSYGMYLLIYGIK